MNLDSNEIQVNILGEQALVDKKKFVNLWSKRLNFSHN